jgi:hypothetical protein
MYNRILTTLLFSVWAGPSLAYVDPGTGSAILSVLIGFFVAISLVIKTFWYKIKRVLGFSKTHSSSDEHDDSGPI